MKLRAIYNKKFGRWVICHDQYCERGETSIVATVTTTLDAKADEEMAKMLAERWNIVVEAGS